MYLTCVQTTGTLLARATARRSRIESGEAAAAGFAEMSRGEPGVQYAAQTSIRRRAGRVPQPMRLENPDAL